MEIGYIIAFIFGLIWLGLHIYEMIVTKGGEFKNEIDEEITVTVDESENCDA